ncbi:hypothetical protein AB0L64_22145 [Kribbella sp. NPDC051936]|uniref:hypothetical protein n=1 Tax=Kribbella sp. NPDC051936 TaxID=3154946 RepID=UPI003414FE09
MLGVTATLALVGTLLTPSASDWITDCQYGTYQNRASNRLTWKYPFPGTKRPAPPLECGRGVMVQYDDAGGSVVGRYQTGVICW